jgi:hypothetical protein
VAILDGGGGGGGGCCKGKWSGQGCRRTFATEKQDMLGSMVVYVFLRLG